MNRKELMLDDLVQICNETAKVVEVSSIVAVEFTNGGYDVFEEKDVIPIDITNETLKNFGFYGEGYLYYDIDEHTYLEYYPHEHRLRKIYKGIDEWQNHSEVKDIVFQSTCRYLHEFQHDLLRCGIKKKVIL